MKRHTLYIYAFALSAFALASCSKDLTEGLDDVNVGVATDAGMEGAPRSTRGMRRNQIPARV